MHTSTCKAWSTTCLTIPMQHSCGWSPIFLRRQAEIFESITCISLVCWHLTHQLLLLLMDPQPPSVSPSSIHGPVLLSATDFKTGLC
jgi:hypothetical protein